MEDLRHEAIQVSIAESSRRETMKEEERMPGIATPSQAEGHRSIFHLYYQPSTSALSSFLAAC